MLTPGKFYCDLQVIYIVESLEIGSDQSEASVSHMTSTIDDSDWSG